MELAARMRPERRRTSAIDRYLRAPGLPPRESTTRLSRQRARYHEQASLRHSGSLERRCGPCCARSAAPRSLNPIGLLEPSRAPRQMFSSAVRRRYSASSRSRRRRRPAPSPRALPRRGSVARLRSLRTPRAGARGSRDSPSLRGGLRALGSCGSDRRSVGAVHTAPGSSASLPARSSRRRQVGHRNREVQVLPLRECPDDSTPDEMLPRASRPARTAAGREEEAVICRCSWFALRRTALSSNRQRKGTPDHVDAGPTDGR